jgi:hypothetical protein
MKHYFYILLTISWNSSLFCQRLSQHRCVGESAQSLEMPVTDRPDMGERHIDGHGSFSSLSLDTTERDHFLARGNELFSDEANVESFIETRKKTLEHVLEALEMAAADRHPLRQIVNDVRRLETSQRLSMSWHGSFVEARTRFSFSSVLAGMFALIEFSFRCRS